VTPGDIARKNGWKTGGEERR